MKSQMGLLDTLNEVSSLIHLLQMACADLHDEAGTSIYVATTDIERRLNEARSIIKGEGEGAVKNNRHGRLS